MTRIGLNPDVKPTKQRILIWSKGRTKRNPTNLDEMAIYLASKFNVEVMILEFNSEGQNWDDQGVKKISKSSFTMKEQLEHISQATVVIAPCGGISFTDIWQASGSTQIIIDFWNPNMV